MISDFSSLFQQQDSKVFVACFVGQLLQPNGSTETSWPTTNNAYIDLVSLSFD